MYATHFVQFLSESLGLQAENIVTRISPRGDVPRRIEPWSIDPCYPQNHHRARPQPYLQQALAQAAAGDFLPHIRCACLTACKHKGHNACPTVSVTPETVSSFHKRNGLLADTTFDMWHPLVNLSDHKVLGAPNVQAWADSWPRRRKISAHRDRLPG
jgi:predicted nucleotide-binding protein (sugar kinase/HSP70/actin superfamily)